jgi:hypothetical protein
MLLKILDFLLFASAICAVIHYFLTWIFFDDDMFPWLVIVVPTLMALSELHRLPTWVIHGSLTCLVGYYSIQWFRCGDVFVFILVVVIAIFFMLVSLYKALRKYWANRHTK